LDSILAAYGVLCAFNLHSQELPTDDMNYEAQKELKAEREKERQGAQNALGHNEFMYL